MNTFLKALTTDDILTENLMPTHSTSGNAILDMFFQMGGSRALPLKDLYAMLARALGEDKLLATKATFYNRDIRGGQGERRSFRIFFHYLASNHPEIARKNIENVPFYGRWDDLLIAINTPIEKDALDYILHALKNGDALCAKWMPREGKRHDDIAKHLRETWELSARDYRKLLAGNTNVVEHQMCQKAWGAIVYEHIPSKAMHKYRRAFSRNDGERFGAFLEAVESGEKKIHAGAIFPHDIIRPYIADFGDYDKTVELQWKAQPNYMPEGYQILPVCDTSGSMYGEPLTICVALGMYLAERNLGPFKDAFITFSHKPQLQLLKGDNLHDRAMGLANANWDMNTDLEAMFKLVLDQAVKHNVPAEDMPNTLLIISDMQFDRCIQNASDSALTMAKRMYDAAGYSMPNVVFWNVRTSQGIPAKFDTQGTALVSGCSPSILTSIFTGELEPVKVMNRTLNSERYDQVKV